jgi:CheY-like chemotaxis protein
LDDMKRDANKICVLLAEDDAAIRETMGMVLESEGFEVHTAIDGQDALGQIAAAKVLPDLLITDLMMPNVTGWELVDVIKKLNRTKNIPIIVYSAISHYAAGNPVLRGCYFERKPVELDHLMTTIKTALGGPARDERTQGSSDYITTSEHVRQNGG